MHAQLIDDLVKAFGCSSQAEFGQLLKVSNRRAVSNWKRHGLPWKRQRQIEALASQRGVTLPEQFDALLNEAA